MKENNCQSIECLLDAYHDGELKAGQHAVVSQHLSHCLPCQGKLMEIERVVRSLKSLPQLSLSLDFASGLEQQLALRTAQKNNLVRPLIWGSASIAAAAVVLVWVGGHMGSPGPDGSAWGRLFSSQNQLAYSQAVAHRAGRWSKPYCFDAGQGMAPPEDEVVAGEDEITAPEREMALGPKETASGDNLVYVALNEGEQVSAAEALGISTDEDGLYAIKL